jgi:hypothetical protein
MMIKPQCECAGWWALHPRCEENPGHVCDTNPATPKDPENPCVWQWEHAGDCPIVALQELDSQYLPF